MDWIPAIVGALLSALIAATVSWFGVLLNVRQKSILEARQRWRDELRRILPEFTSTEDSNEREKLRDAITLQLNPYKDQELVATLDEFINEQNVDQRRHVVDSFAEYLKYDWQRAKAEARHRSKRPDKVAAREVAEQRQRHGSKSGEY